MRSCSASIVKYNYCSLSQSEARAFLGFNGMSMLDSIEQLPSNKQIFQMVISHPPEHDDDTLRGMYDWECYKNNPIFQQHKNALQGILYHDEVTGWNLVLSQSATLFMSETTNHIAPLNDRNNRGLDVTYDEHRCKQISSQLLAAKPLTLKPTRCTTF